ncbi:NTP transferase domain-containing protein [Streptomyces sp. L7]
MTRNEDQVAGLLLAAGGGRRLGGRPKALLEHRGRPLVEHAVGVLARGRAQPRPRGPGSARRRRTGAGRADRVRGRGEPGVGAGHGVLAAGRARLARRYGARAVLVSLVDQPGIGAEAVARY